MPKNDPKRESHDEKVIGTLKEHIRTALPSVIEHRRALHAIPELAFEEFETARYLTSALESLGLKVRKEIAETGLLVEMPGSQSGPTIMLRADMDGLPIEEFEEHDPRSRHPGRMHACGHDGHMAIALGACEAWKRASADLAFPGRLLVLFQPAEEAKGGGARRIIESGLLDEVEVDYVLGLHLWSDLERGRAIIPDGTVLASSDEFRVTFCGKGGHAALPHQADDVILAASRFVSAVQSLVSREIDPMTAAVVTIGRFHSGDAANVLPERATLEGTFRTTDPETREMIATRLVETARAGTLGTGIEVDVHRNFGYPATINDPVVAETMRKAASDVLGHDKILSNPPTMASEDFSYFLEARPGAFMLLGMRDEEAGVVHPHHNPRFRIDDRVLPDGIEILLRTAISLMT